ncbi:MAG: spermidine synthase [Flavobacteriaceae bacterium]|nr:MAG: spermidine synthase [Flavobacteriaceae bacterium]
MNLKSNILRIAIFATGLSGIVAEYILSTLATYFLGNSVLQWTMVMSTMLFAMGIGSRLSRSLKTNLLEKFIFIEFTLSFLVCFSSLAVYTASAYTFYAGGLIYGLSMLIGLMIGMEIPLVMRLNNEFQSLRVNISSVLENDYYGSLAGGIFFAFIGLPYLGLTYTPILLGLVNFCVALGLLIVLWKEISNKQQRRITSIAAVVGFILISAFFVAKPIILFGEQKKYKDKIVYSEQSKYQKIVITQWKNDFWLYINGNQQLSSFDEEMYHEPLVHPIMSLTKTPHNILILGGGDGCAVREILKYEDVKTITLVDLDPAMTNLGKENKILRKMNKNAFDSDKLQIINTDGYNFIENTDQRYDVIIIDLPDPKTIEMSRLYSYEFYRKCYKHLRKHGVIITQAGSPYFASDAFNCINKTMQKANFTTIPMHNQVVTLGEWGWILGAKNISEENLKKELHSLKFDHMETRWINNEAMKLLTSFGKDFFKKDNLEIKTNEIHDPVLYKYYLNGTWDIY